MTFEDIYNSYAQQFHGNKAELTREINAVLQTVLPKAKMSRAAVGWWCSGKYLPDFWLWYAVYCHAEGWLREMAAEVTALHGLKQVTSGGDEVVNEW